MAHLNSQEIRDELDLLSDENNVCSQNEELFSDLDQQLNDVVDLSEVNLAIQTSNQKVLLGNKTATSALQCSLTSKSRGGGGKKRIARRSALKNDGKKLFLSRAKKRIKSVLKLTDPVHPAIAPIPKTGNLRQSRINFNNLSNDTSPSTAKSYVPIQFSPVNGRPPSSPALSYFQYDNLTNKSKCVIGDCNGLLTGKHATNYKNHLRSFHPNEYEIVENMSKKINEMSKKGQSQRSQDRGQLTIDNNLKLTVQKYESGNIKQEKFTKQMSIMIGANPIPNSLVQYEDFKRLIGIADSKLTVISQPTLEIEIDNMMATVKQNLLNRLNSARKLTISADIWTKKGLSTSYLGVMATYYDTEEHKKTTVCLAVRKFPTVTHKAVDILRIMSTVALEFGLTPEKVWYSMTDSASNMICSFRDLQEILIMNQQISEEAIDSDSIESEDENLVGEHETSNFEMPTYNRLPCFIHSLLCSLKKFDKDEASQQILDRVKKLVKKFSTSHVLTGELVKEQNLKLVSFSKIRWNTIFLMLDRLILLKDTVVEILEKYDQLKYNLTDEEWERIVELRTFLKPFNDYTDMSSADEDVCCSEVVPIIISLRDHLGMYEKSATLRTIANDILVDLNWRFESYFSNTEREKFQGIFLASTMLDLRYRVTLSEEQIRLASSYILENFGRIENEIEEEAVVTPKKRKFSFMNKLSKNSPEISVDLNADLQKFLRNKDLDTEDDKFNPWTFWEHRSDDYKFLGPLALDILSVPMSTAPVERLFSVAGIATNGRRNRLEGQHLEREVFLSKNRKFM